MPPVGRKDKACWDTLKFITERERQVKFFIFNEIYGVAANSLDEAKKKLAPHLNEGHQWYLQPGADNPRKQGHLTIKEVPFEGEVALL